MTRLAIPILALPAVLACLPAAAHEAWLLTPDEVEALARTPPPALFTSGLALGAASAVACALAAAALRLEDRFGPLETRALAPLAARAANLGPMFLRLGLATMLALGALGGLPRQGTTPWTSPTLFVPDMQLALVPGWGWLAGAQLALALALALGVGTRFAAAGVALLSLAGFGAFGLAFLAYAPHFLGPALMLMILGGGAAALDRPLGIETICAPPRRIAEAGWTAALALLGGCFVYLAIAFKLTQPTLIMAILDHGKVPLLGLPLAVAALVMTGVELVAGTLLLFGRLTRPIALLLIGAFTFFAVTIGETPLFHANLYGAMAMLLLAGRALPAEPRAAMPGPAVPA